MACILGSFHLQYLPVCVIISKLSKALNFWLVVSNMNFMTFHSGGKNDPN